MSKLIVPLAQQKFFPWRKIKIFTVLCRHTMKTFEVAEKSRFNPRVYSRCYCSEKKDSSKLAKVKPAEVGTPKTLKQG
jgi:hypothetical protein